MEISNNTDLYHDTRKGAVIGATAGGLLSVGQYAAAKGNYCGLKGSSMAIKRQRISILKDVFEANNIDMSKTTVSNAVKKAQKYFMTKGLAKNVFSYALIGTGIGAVMDYMHNRNHSKK